MNYCMCVVFFFFCFINNETIGNKTNEMTSETKVHLPDVFACLVGLRFMT